MQKNSDKETKNLLEELKELANNNHVCPHCGRCPVCGKRYNDYPYYPVPYSPPIWPQPYYPDLPYHQRPYFYEYTTTCGIGF